MRSLRLIFISLLFLLLCIAISVSDLRAQSATGYVLGSRYPSTSHDPQSIWPRTVCDCAVFVGDFTVTW
jgi:hypothetical protein